MLIGLNFKTSKDRPRSQAGRLQDRLNKVNKDRIIRWYTLKYDNKIIDKDIGYSTVR